MCAHGKENMLDSKRPDEALILSLLDGDPRARAIVNSWRVKLPVTVLPTDEFDALVRKSHTVFDCPRLAEGDGGWVVTPAAEDEGPDGFKHLKIKRITAFFP